MQGLHFLRGYGRCYSSPSKMHWALVVEYAVRRRRYPLQRFHERKSTHTTPATTTDRRLSVQARLIRERVGIEGHMYPEYYFSEHMLPKLVGTTTILDIGANVGQFAIPIAKSGHRVISIEPNEKTCEKLKENLAETTLTTQVICPHHL